MTKDFRPGRIIRFSRIFFPELLNEFAYCREVQSEGIVTGPARIRRYEYLTAR